ncbi:MAG: hypothetical protein ACRD01_03780 [Terriglobales bacterium]
MSGRRDAGGRAAAVLLAGLSLAAGGCALFHGPPPLPPVIIPQSPILFLAAPPSPPPMPLPNALNPAVAGSDAPVFAALAMPPAPVPPRRAPAPERRAPAPAAADAPRPQLSAELSPAQRNAYRGRVQQLLGRAQSELATLYRRNLGNEAAATRAQAGEFVHQAQQAIEQGDWVRAETLAQKADALARYLLGQ